MRKSAMKLSADRVSASEPIAGSPASTDDQGNGSAGGGILRLARHLPVRAQTEGFDKYSAKTRTTSSTRLDTWSFR
jgi:hypothetical protein